MNENKFLTLAEIVSDLSHYVKMKTRWTTLKESYSEEGKWTKLYFKNNAILPST